LDLDFLAGVADFEGFRLAGGDRGGHQFAVFPGNRDLEAAAREQAADFAIGECRGQGRQQVDEAGFLEAMKPEIGDSKRNLQCPFFYNEKSRMKALESIERIITEQPKNAKVIFAKDVVKNVEIQ
jgi:hypothetical protein